VDALVHVLLILKPPTLAATRRNLHETAERIKRSFVAAPAQRRRVRARETLAGARVEPAKQKTALLSASVIDDVEVLLVRVLGAWTCHC
jgi:hypothetical protein